MKKFVNNVENILTESLSGFGKAHPDIIKINLINEDTSEYQLLHHKSNIDK